MSSFECGVVLACVAVAAGLLGIWWGRRGWRGADPRQAIHAPQPHERGLAADDLRAALAQVADWIFLCDAQGTIRHVLVADIDALEPGECLRGRTLASLLAMLGAEPASLLPSAGTQVATTLADFGVGLRKIVPVRLAVMRLASADDGTCLAVATSRSEEVGFEDAIRVLGARMERLQQDSEELRRKILYITEEEQVRIGRELHDGIGQQLAGIAFLAHSLSDRMLRRQDADDEQFRQLRHDGEWVSQLAAKALESCRHLARELSSVQAHHGDLHTALAQLCRDAGAVYGADCALAAPAQAARRLTVLPPAVARHVFRIAQEAVNNALRHGRARQVRVSLARTRGGFRLAVADDGSGFELRRYASGAHAGLGLSSMRVRATLLGGRLRIRTRVRGTLVMLVAPLSAGDEGAA